MYIYNVICIHTFVYRKSVIVYIYIHIVINICMCIHMSSGQMCTSVCPMHKSMKPLIRIVPQKPQDLDVRLL